MPRDLTAQSGVLLVWVSVLDQSALSGAPSAVTDRLLAAACAMHLTGPTVIATGAFNVGDVTKYLQTFEAWLTDATDDSDRHVRRVLLALVCDQASPATPPDRIRSFLKALHLPVRR